MVEKKHKCSDAYLSRIGAHAQPGMRCSGVDAKQRAEAPHQPSPKATMYAGMWKRGRSEGTHLPHGTRKRK